MSGVHQDEGKVPLPFTPFISSSPTNPERKPSSSNSSLSLSPSVPSSPPYIHPVDVAAAPTTNSNGVGLPLDHPNSNLDPKPTFDENKAEILRLKLPHAHAHVQPNIYVWV
ncbi:hypothetical protein RHMOL_Rhmol02G0187900 [Rhododendron molle]|uniref:Uncharacterized protein n=1 Tax=Rhododendron molle TaxID=49168 RepID=A0ACC0PT39_RHOML|nr:hypothetical protein RHMOL_Rhmol02G0187900 [Rhododendron molle]